jgi:cell division GTPase FtsZ
MAEAQTPEEDISEEQALDEDWNLPDSEPAGLDDFDFVEAYSDKPADDDRMLEENTAPSAINCAFVGFGGGGGKMVKAFLDLGFNKSILINTTEKDQPDDIKPENFLLLPGADGVGKDVKLGKEILDKNSAYVEDALRTRLGKIDWLFVLAGAGGGTGSACHTLHATMSRYLKSIAASGKVVYIVSRPSNQELLNPTIKANCDMLIKNIRNHPHILIDNEKQLELLRGKVGMLNMYPAANKNFAKLLAQIFKLADEPSPIQVFDSKDLERCLRTNGRMLVGSTVVRNPEQVDLGASIFQGSIKASPCPNPQNTCKTGVLLLITTPEMANNPAISNKLEAAFSYVGGRAETLFSGVYIRKNLPGIIALILLGGMS